MEMFDRLKRKHAQPSENDYLQVPRISTIA